MLKFAQQQPPRQGPAKADDIASKKNVIKNRIN